MHLFFILLRTPDEQIGSIAGSKADNDCAERRAAAVPPPVLTLLGVLPADGPLMALFSGCLGLLHKLCFTNSTVE